MSLAKFLAKNPELNYKTEHTEGTLDPMKDDDDDDEYEEGKEPVPVSGLF